MDWWIIVTVALAVGGIVSTVILTLKLHKTKKPSWAHKTQKIIGLGRDAPPELELLFNKKPIGEVHRTTFIFFNRGTQAIRKDDVTEDIAILFKGAKILRGPTIRARSKEANELVAKSVVNKQGQYLIQLGFKYLDHDDGAVVEVLHTPSKLISCVGNVIEAKDMADIGEFWECYYRPSGIKLIFAFTVVIVILSATLLSVFGFLPSPPEHQTAIRGILYGTSGVLIGLVTAALAHVMRIYLRCRKFPSWARGAMTEEASNLAAKGIPLKAYCFGCRAKKTIKHPQFVTLKNGRPAVRGVCPDCGAKIFRIGET